MGTQTNDSLLQLVEKYEMLHIGRTAVQNCSCNFVRRLTIESQMWFWTVHDYS